MRRLAALFLAGLLAGCAVGPDYRRPAAELPESFRYSETGARDIANTAWWRQFGDPVLDGLVDNALANNKSVRIAAANIEQAAAILTQTRAPMFPQASYGAEAVRSRASETDSPALYNIIPNPQTNLSVFAAASWEIDLWGRIRRQTEAARANLLATEEARRGAVLSLVASVAGTYLQLRGLDEQLLIAKRTLNTYAESLRLFEIKHKYGQVSRMNVEQARTQYESAAAAIPDIESQIVQTENALSILLGKNPGPIPRGRSLDEIALPAVPAAIPADVLERRPDIAQAEQNLVAANARIGAARALYFPTISLTGAYGYASSELSDLFKGSSRTWSWSGSVVGPIFTAGSISGQVREAEAAERATLLAYQSSIQSAFADVENSLVARAKLAEQVQAQERLVAASGEYTRLAKLQYDGGYAPYMTVIQAQEQLFPAELNLVRYRASLFASFVQIYKSLGGGWETETAKPAETGDRRAAR